MTTPLNFPRRIIVVGAAMMGTGYPNARNTISLLHGMDEVELIDCSHPLPEELHLWKLARGNLAKKLSGAVQIGLLNLASILSALIQYRPQDILYIPYPSLPILWLFSWIPKILRPTTFCDAYITLWDSFYQDRRIGNESSLFSKCLHLIESRALRSASKILVDTSANVKHLHRLFNIPRSQFNTLPLATDGSSHGSCKKAPRPDVENPPSSPVNVLFFGTFVPLQGTKIIIEAIAILNHCSDIKFTLIGDGQQASEIEEKIVGLKNITWIRTWQTPSQLEHEIDSADICLGIFGGEGKAARVLPLKLYMALAHGKAIITQESYSTPDGSPHIPALTIEPTAKNLAKAITELSKSPQNRTKLEHAASKYYERHLSSGALRASWIKLLSN